MPQTILVVDDDPYMRWSLAANLEDEGFVVHAFAGGPDVLKYLGAGGEGAAMLLDWQMPDMDGLDVLRHLRENGHGLPVLFLTGHSLAGRREVALAGGATAFLDKTKSFSTILHYLHLALSDVAEPAGPSPLAAVERERERPRSAFLSQRQRGGRTEERL
jgi:CheY-like chemotaxis protein